jgi:hypothetical protein
LGEENGGKILTLIGSDGQILEFKGKLYSGLTQELEANQ